MSPRVVEMEVHGDRRLSASGAYSQKCCAWVSVGSATVERRRGGAERLY